LCFTSFDFAVVVSSQCPSQCKGNAIHILKNALTGMETVELVAAHHKTRNKTKDIREFAVEVWDAFLSPFVSFIEMHQASAGRGTSGKAYSIYVCVFLAEVHGRRPTASPCKTS
jgi:hypothetical protein